MLSFVMNKMQKTKLFVLLIACISVLDGKGRYGVNGDSFTSSYYRLDPASTDIPLDDAIFASPKGYNAPQQVHLTQGDYDGKAVIISWITPHEQGSDTVYYGTSSETLSSSATATVISYNFTGYESGYIHHCLVDNLEYNTTYYYQIGSGSTARQFSFQTPPEIGPDSPYTFGLIGDLGQTNHSLSTLQHYTENEGQTVLFVGDFTYADRHSENATELGMRWDTWGRLMEFNNAYQPWIWSTGNHDQEQFPDYGIDTDFHQFQMRYPTPYKASNSTSPLWYAIRRGPAHIIVLSSYSAFVKYTAQYKWLNAHLAKVDRSVTPWLIVVMHVPFYNSNSAHYMEGESMRAAYEQWFIDYKVDLVFAGHVHAYERSHRVSNVKYNISNGACTPVLDETAPMYINIGDGGNSEGIAGEYNDPQPDYSAFREASFGHAILDIKNKTHAYYHWHRNDNGTKVTADSVLLRNLYWTTEYIVEVENSKLYPSN